MAALVLLTASLRNLTGPWEHGMRGVAAASYSDGAVAHTLAYGLGTTLGLPTFVVDRGTGLERRVNWHHPPAYWLWLSLAAWVFGHEPGSLRAAHLLLFLPGLLGLFLLVRRRHGPRIAGITALLFATCPLVAYFGPMVLQDGAVLGFGLLAAAGFQRLLDAPSWRSWSATAVCFFVACSLDYSGYWWGPVMFVLALGAKQPRRAIVWVLSFLPVAMLAFAVMAVHYGLAMGGPFGFVSELLHVVRADHHDARAQTTWPQVAAALRDVLIEHGNAPLLVLALSGVVLAVAVRGRELLGLLWLGLALSLPGVLNCGSMVVHALNHPFWSMHGFAGLCALAAVLPVLGLRWLQGDGLRRLAGAALLLLAGAAATFGAVHTHRLISRHAFVDNGTPAIMRKAVPHLTRCSWALTSADAVPQVFFGTSQTFGGIDTAEKLDACLGLARAASLRGQVGFVVHPRHRDSQLVTKLDGMAAAVVVDDIRIYRLPLGN